MSAADWFLRAWKLRGCRKVGAGVWIRGRVCAYGGGEIHVGDRVVLDGRRAPIELHALPGAILVLEDEVEVGAGTSIEACESVCVGRSAQVGEFCKIMDNHFHPLRGDRTTLPASRPVAIGPGARLGPHSVVLPGASVGSGAVVRARAVVSRSVPRGANVAGPPTRSRVA